MRHLLMDPAFPDIVGDWAANSVPSEEELHANDNDGEDGSELSDPLLAIRAQLEVAATRLW